MSISRLKNNQCTDVVLFRQSLNVSQVIWTILSGHSWMSPADTPEKSPHLFVETAPGNRLSSGRLFVEVCLSQVATVQGLKCRGLVGQCHGPIDKEIEKNL